MKSIFGVVSCVSGSFFWGGRFDRSTFFGDHCSIRVGVNCPVFTYLVRFFFPSQDVTSEVALAHPVLYRDGAEEVFLNPKIFWT